LTALKLSPASSARSVNLSYSTQSPQYYPSAERTIQVELDLLDQRKERPLPEGEHMPPILERRILIADDERAIADTLAAILGQVGFSTRAVYSGETALEVAEFYLPDMFISDVVMGGMTGIEAAINLSRMLPDCKILLFSSQAATMNLSKEAEKHGRTFEILAKPVHPVDLIEKVRTCLSAQGRLLRWRTIRTL
jgi:CheY-like chemotaxis protein